MGEKPRQRGSGRAARDVRRVAPPQQARANASTRKSPAARKNSKNAKPPKRKVSFPGRWYIIVPLALIVLAAIIGFWYYPSLKIAYHEARNERVLGAQLEAINKYNAQLDDQIKSLETTTGVEAYARQELNLVQKGDHVVIVTRDGKPLTTDQDTQITALENLSTVKKPFGAWTAFLDRLFGAE